MRLIPLVIASVVFSGTASAATGPIVYWGTKDMKTAIHAVGYPKPRLVKLACTGQTPGSPGLFASFRCTTTYKHHVRRRFIIAAEGEGGWLCAGKTLTGCKLLRLGFVTTAVVNSERLANAANTAARGWLVDHGQFPYQVVHFCEASGTAWSCPFTVNNESVTVTVTLKRAKGGYVVAASST